ncbi:DUF5009 domain-containing protein [bacterium]|nr:DUF5009 domain-containing protein [bacterium]
MSEKAVAAGSGRVVSIDALRGFDMFWITGGGGIVVALLSLFHGPLAETLLRQTEHSVWNGFTYWDLIFPMFMFIVGVSLPFAISRRLERGEDRAGLYKHIVRRFLTLMILGFVYNGLLDFNMAQMRWAGVLQRISLGYLFAALILMNTRVRGQVIWAAAILLVYWVLMTLVPVPGHGAGVLTPEGNLAAWLDNLFLPGQFCNGIFDNEGILSTLPSISTVLMGVLAGHWLRGTATPGVKAVRLALAGVASLVLALIWNPFFPINKLIWTSSYVLFAGGWSLLLLALFYWVIDVKGWKRWAFPFVVIGLNPITIYVAGALFDFGSIVNIFVHGFIDSLGAIKPLFWALCVFGVKWLFLYFLYTRKIFLKA